MEDKVLFIEPLVEKAEQYTKTSFELIKLKAIYNTTKVASTVVSRGLFLLVVSIAITFLTLGVALWLGDILGKSYYGFFCVALFYVILGGVLYFYLHSKIKDYVSNSIIYETLN
ncbi:MAG: hypothetical protein H7331_04880 [Bacteroidia bacterium]|nr:hypothetical protein [Bacteroidia bacterium]